jgi:hypothetical protein
VLADLIRGGVKRLLEVAGELLDGGDVNPPELAA